MTNEELLQKAITAVETLAANGKLNPAQADKFIDYVVDESVMENNVRVARFTNEQLDIDKMDIGGRVVFPATEYQAPEYRSGVSTTKISLTPKEVIAAFDISDSFKELNIQGDSIEDSIIKMFAKGWRNDTETMALKADVLGPSAVQSDIYTGTSDILHIKDPLLAMFDGWFRLADGSHLVDADDANIGLSIFGQALRAMPQKFRRNKKDLRFFMSSDLHQIYIEKVATRQTPKGDQAAEGQTQTPFGVPIVEVPLVDFRMPVVEHVQLNGTTAVNLRYAPMSAEAVLPEALNKTPTAPYVEGAGNDYVMDYTAGTIARDAAGTIGDGDTVKVTYLAQPQLLLTHWMNFVYGIGRDVRIERARNIHKRANEFVVTGKLSVQIEETDALVKVYNIGTGV